MRLSNLIEALLPLGEIDLVCTDTRETQWTDPPKGVSLIRLPEGKQLTAKQWLPKWVRSKYPRRVVWRDFGPVRNGFVNLGSDYDIAVFGHLELFVGLGSSLACPVIVDFDNLENLSMRSQRNAGPDVYPHMSALERTKATVKWLMRSGIDLIDERRWERAQHEVGSQTSKVLVCSTLDVVRSECANAVCVPNGYEPPETGANIRPGALDDPSLMFVGSMGYPPNADAARWFATEVFPLVQKEIPQSQLRLVGRNPESITDLSSLSGVEVVGQVPEISVELTRSDIAVVPIRSGAGTRLKVLEAMAYGLPIASTVLGSEGIDVVRDESAVLEDAPQALADGIVRLSRDEGLRRSMTTEALKIYEANYRWDTIKQRFAELATSVSQSQS